MRQQSGESGADTPCKAPEMPQGRCCVPARGKSDRLKRRVPHPEAAECRAEATSKLLTPRSRMRRRFYSSAALLLNSLVLRAPAYRFGVLAVCPLLVKYLHRGGPGTTGVLRDGFGGGCPDDGWGPRCARRGVPRSR